MLVPSTNIILTLSENVGTTLIEPLISTRALDTDAAFCFVFTNDEACNGLPPGVGCGPFNFGVAAGAATGTGTGIRAAPPQSATLAMLDLDLALLATGKARGTPRVSPAAPAAAP